jgi:hypothetical protein
MEWKPGCPEWEDENGSPEAEESRYKVLQKLIRVDHKKPPSVELVKSWHRTMFEGRSPCDAYVGQFRDKDLVPYCLQDCEVEVGGVLGTSSELVLEEVEVYFAEFIDRLKKIEQSHAFEEESAITKMAANSVVQLAA